MPMGINGALTMGARFAIEKTEEAFASSSLMKMARELQRAKHEPNLWQVYPLMI